MKKNCIDTFLQSRKVKKILLMMKLTAILLLLGLMQVSATVYSQATKFDFEADNKKIEEVLREIEGSSNFRFFYIREQVDVERLVSINAEDATVEDILTEIFAGENISFEVMQDDLILLSPSDDNIGPESVSTFQQQNTVTGRVTDNTGEPLPGVTVVVQGTTQGTITDFNGDYSLENVSPEDILQFSFVGMETQEIAVGSQTNIDVTMAVSSIGLEEVVAVGYGVVRKSVVTGAISSVTADDVKNTTFTRADQALQGKTSGVQVINTSGAPGSETKIRIRGYSSNGTADPLFIVDGMKVNDINNIDPNDISNMEVLKDAASAAIYGAEGGNGVVIITTRSASAGGSTINYDFQYTIQSIGETPEMVNNYEYAEYYAEAGNFTVPESEVAQRNTDWLAATFEPAAMKKHYISFSSGTEKSNFLLSLSSLDQDGIVVGDKDRFKRYTARMNSDSQITDWLKVGHNFSYAYTKRNSVNEDSENGGTLSSAILMDPLTPVYYEPGQEPEHVVGLLDMGEKLVKDENGNYYGISKWITRNPSNPLVNLAVNKAKTQHHYLQGNVFSEIQPLEDLVFTSRLGYELIHQNYHSWTPIYYYNDYTAYSTRTNVVDNNNRTYRLLWENFANYSLTVSDHSFSFLAGMSSEIFSSKYTNAEGGPMINELENFAQLNFISTQQNSVVSGTENIDKKVSYFGRINYDYMSKYLFQASLRRDGASTSLLPKENRWGIFPALSAGWVFTQENFFPESFISYGKIRASWGQNGSLSNLNNYMYRASITSTGLFYQLADNNIYTAAVPDKLNNPDLTWETSVQTDIGIDLRMFDDRVNFTVDYFNKKTTDLITPNTPPIESGNTPPAVNGGDVLNRGFEFDLGYRNSINDFDYGINLNLSTLHNEVTYLNPTIQRILGGESRGAGLNYTAFEQGFPVWYFWGYETEGINSTTGEAIFVDNEPDGIINDSDKRMLGSAIPELTFGGSLNLMYKDFDFSMNVQGQYGNELMILWLRNDLPGSNIPRFLFDDRWTPENTTATQPKAGFNPITLTSDLLMFDGTYLRIKQIQLGYTLPDNVLNILQMESARVYVSLEDYFTFTNFPGMDPEAGSSQNSSIGLDRGMYPITRKALFGLSVTF